MYFGIKKKKKKYKNHLPLFVSDREGKTYLRVFLFFGSSTTTLLFSYLYTNFLEFFSFLINFNHFLIKSHKPDLFSLINKLARNFRKNFYVHNASDVFTRFALKYVFSEYLHYFLFSKIA